MQQIHVIRNKVDRHLQTAWFSETAAKQQAEATQKEMEAEDFPPDECGYEVVAMDIQDSVPEANFSDGWWMLHGGPLCTKLEKAVEDFVDRTGWEFEDALLYMIAIVRDRRS